MPKSLIYRAMLNYGYNNLDLIILKSSDSNQLIKCEQFYIDNIKPPEHNILKVAGSSFGFKASPEALLKNEKYRKE